MTDHNDTIYALSSGGLPSGVAIIRLSGPKVRFGIETLCGSIPEPRIATLKSIRTQNDLLIDRALVLFFESPHSFTGEDCGEFHLHGGRAVVQACLNALSLLDGFRLAEAGEFSRRAFDNNKIDLTEAEGLADLIAAETEMQRRLAVSQANGGLKEVYQAWAASILKARALIEAELDFSDEDDIPGSVSDLVWDDMIRLRDELKKHLSRSQLGEVYRNGYNIVIAGAPNVGKSTLLNHLVGRDAAIVSDIAGTTRDVLEVRLDLDGCLVQLRDTAGIRDSSDEVEAEGMKRALASFDDADLILHLTTSDIGNALSDETLNIHADKMLHIHTKSDIDSEMKQNLLSISAKTGAGVDHLIAEIKTRLNLIDPLDDLVIPTRARHVEYLKSALSSLEQAIAAENLPIELRSEFLRQAQDDVGRITGRVDVEDLLGVIFSEFCVGK